MSIQSNAPIFNGPVFAGLPSLSLSDDESRTASWLAMRLFSARPTLEIPNYYYNAEQKMQDLGISIPPQLRGLRTVVGWPQIGVDALVNRCIVEGFRYPDATDVDEDLMSIWQANNLDAEAPLANLDALVYGRAYGIVGPADADSTTGQPLITFESPVNMIAMYDARIRRVTSAFQIFMDSSFTSDMYGHEVAALYLPDRTIHMAREVITDSPNGGGQWEITDRDDHGLGFVPVVRLANRQRLQDRQGVSEIRPSWRNTVDSTVRTLLGAEVGREFFAAPRRYALGVTEDSFQKADGSPATAWETYVNKVWMLERDEDGNLPTVGQFAPGDPSVFTKLIDQYAEIMAGEMGLPPHMLGLHSDGNPASADAIRSGYEELTSRAKMKHVAFSDSYEDLMRLALLIRDGSVPDQAHMMETDWRDPAPLTLAGVGDFLQKLIMAGSVPAASDVVLKRAGFSAVERMRLEQDRAVDQGASMLEEIAHSLQAKAVRTDVTIQRDAANAADGGQVTNSGGSSSVNSGTGSGNG